MWIDSLPIPRGLYDGCAHEFLKAVKNMLSFDPRNRPTMKDLITHFRCSCSTWPLSSSQAPIAIHNQCHGPANETLLSTSLQPLYGFPSWLRSYSEAVPSRYTSGNHMADENKLVGPWKFNRTYKTEDCQQLPHFRENAMFLEKRLELGLLWIKSDAGFGDIPLMVPIICYVSVAVLTCHRVDPSLLRHLSASKWEKVTKGYSGVKQP